MVAHSLAALRTALSPNLVSVREYPCLYTGVDCQRFGIGYFVVEISSSFKRKNAAASSKALLIGSVFYRNQPAIFSLATSGKLFDLTASL
jgi:hypothetical protein